MKNTWDAVAAFMEAGGQTIGQENTKNIHRYRWPYLHRVEDEMTETFHAIIADDEVEIADGYADTIYAAMTALLNLAGREKAERIFQAVVDANSSKVDGSLGPVRRDENGKILKPAGFVPPNQKIKKSWRDKRMPDWLRYHNYCMREAHDIASVNLAVAASATLAATTAAFSHDGTFQKILAIGLWWVIFVRFTHTNRIRPKQQTEEKQ